MENKKIKVFNVPWHVANQYEIYKIPDLEIYHCIQNIRKWAHGGKSFRPIQTNIHEVTHYEPGKYDFALLHIDQQCVDPAIGKGRLYRELNEEIRDIPKIVINHGTPYWPEQFESEELVTKMKMLIGNNFMIVNSHRAKEMWGPMGSGVRTILHGLDPSEWWDLPKEPRVITMLSPDGLNRYYNRKLLAFVKEKLADRGIPHTQITVDWVADGFDDYRDFIGRSLVYFNPTLESPMPRSRTEAMLSGACVVTLGNHGPEEWIENGKNGFVFPNFDPYASEKPYDPIVIVDTIEWLLNNYEKAKAIGQEGKKTALELFSQDRFQREWMDTINHVLGRKHYDL